MDSSSSSYLARSNEYTEVYSAVPFKQQLAYGVGHVLNDICASMWFTYLLVFFHLVLGFSNREAGVVLLVGQIADALATPFVGFYSDQDNNFWVCRYGRRKIWHLLGTICVLGTFPFIFSPCVHCENAHKWAQLFYYCMFVVIFQFGWAAVQISHLSLIPELTPNENDRIKLTAVRYSFTVISNLLVYGIAWFILHIGRDGTTQIGPQDAGKFQQIVFSGISIGFITSICFHFFVKEENDHSNVDNVGQLRTSVKDLLTNIKVYLVALIYMTTRLFVNLSQIFIPLYLHESLKMVASSLALIPLIMYIGSFVTSIFIEVLNRKLGRKHAYVLGGLLAVAGCLWVQYGSDTSIVQRDIYFIALLYGSGGSIVLVTSLGITADLIGDKTGSGAFVYGVMSFCDKLANGIAVIIIQDLHQNKSEYYKHIITYICGISVLIGILTVVIQKDIRGGVLDGYESIPGTVSSINTE